MPCNCACTCPIEVGDRIRYKLDPDGFHPTTRINGGLILTLMYLSEFNAIYWWEGHPHPKGYQVAYGETHMTREEFDRLIERVPGQ